MPDINFNNKKRQRMNDDLISRSALRARYQEILDRGDMFCEYDIIGMVDNAPPVGPQKIVTIPTELIEKLAKCVVDTIGNIDWDKAIEAYKARPQSEWIPVSERLPDEDGEEYLVYRKTDTFVKRPFRIDIARWYSDDTENNGFNKYSEVIAWMPLPEPYKEQKQKKEEPITLTDEQITEMYESGYISEKEEFKDGND